MEVASDHRKSVWLGSVAVGLLLLGLAVGEQSAASRSPDGIEGRSPAYPVQSLSPEQRATLSTGLTSGTTLRGTYAVASKRHARVWYVAGQIAGAEGGPTVAVWVMTGSRSEPGFLFSVNSTAHSISVWPDVRTSRIRASAVDREALAVTTALERQ